MRRIGLILTVLVLTPVICVGALFFIPGPKGKPLLNMESLKASLVGEGSMVQKVKEMRRTAGKQADAISRKARARLKPAEPEPFNAPFEAPDETLFKWQDENGQWHYSNQLPEGREDFEVID